MIASGFWAVLAILAAHGSPALSAGAFDEIFQATDLINSNEMQDGTRWTYAIGPNFVCAPMFLCRGTVFHQLAHASASLN
jgi:hypothetical protein